MTTQTTAEDAGTAEAATPIAHDVEVPSWRPVPIAWRPPRPLDVLRVLSGVTATSLGLGYVPQGGRP